MSEPFLILHKVRGEPAFDIAEKIECGECHGDGCPECDSLGFWWIIPTSGHRAYPAWNIELSSLGTDESWPGEPGFCSIGGHTDDADLTNLPDHYSTRYDPAPKAKPLTELLKLTKPTEPMRRRI